MFIFGALVSFLLLNIWEQNVEGCKWGGNTPQIKDVEQRIKEAKLDSDLNIIAPKKLLEVAYNGRAIQPGDALGRNDTSDRPTLKFDPIKDKLITVFMLDPDAPSALNPIRRAILHWMIINVRENDINTGNTTADYIGPAPPAGSGPHRYTFLIFQQAGFQNITETLPRSNFNVSSFISQYSLTGPIAGNFMTVEVK